ncbi:MAG: anti-sigma factor family protein, partial [Planctomycetota bacterium]
MEKHEEMNELLVGFVLGELSEHEQSQVQAHIAKCPECSIEVERLKGLLECTNQMKELSADDQLRETAKEAIFAAIRSEQKQPGPSLGTNVAWRAIMKGRMAKLVAAAVIIMAAGIGVVIFSSLNQGDGTIVGEGSHDALQAELEQVRQMFAASDVRGLERMLREAKFDKSKVLAANYLAMIGDDDSAELLQQAYEQYDGNEPAAFTEAIAEIQARAAEESGPDEVNDIAPPVDMNEAVVGTKAGPAVVQGPDELLELIPADSMFCVRVNNFDYVFGMLDQYLVGISPVPMGATMFARMQLVGALGDPALNDVNTAGDFAIFGTGSPVEPNEDPLDKLFIAALFPVTDYNKFVSDNPSCGQPDANGISVIKAGGALNPDKKILVADAGGYALLGSAGDYAKLLSIAKSVSKTTEGLAASLDADEVAAATTQPLWAYGSIQEAARVFGPMVYAQLEQLKKQIEQMNANDQGGAPPPEVMNIYFGMFDILTQEIESVSIHLNPKADVLNLTIGAAAVPNTLMAKMFVADTSGRANTLLGYLEDGAIGSAAFKMNTPFMQELSMTELDFIAYISDQNIPDEAIDKFEDLMADMVSCAAGPGVVSFAYRSEGWPPFVAKYVIAVKDEQRWRELVKAGAELYNTGGLADFQGKMGVEYRYEINEAAYDYNGVSIDVGKFVMEPNDPNSMYGTLIDQMYHGGFDFRYAIVNGLWLCVFGADCNSTMQELIDQAKAGGPEEMPPETASALEFLTQSETAEFKGTVNIIRYLNMAASMLASVDMSQPGQVGPPIVPVDIATSSNVAFAGTVGNGKIAFEIAMPKQHLSEIKAGLMTMQEQITLIMARQQAIRQVMLSAGAGSGTPGDYRLPAGMDITADEQSAIKGLRTFAEISDGRYPSELDLMKTLTEAGEALRISLVSDPNRDPSKPITQEEIMPKLMQIEATVLFYTRLVRDGNEVTYRGGTVTAEFPHAALMYWKISDDKYRVIFADLTAESVTAERLAELEAMPLNLSPKAVKPDPADGKMARTVADLELSWMPGLNAVEHRVYLGTSAEALSLVAEVPHPRCDDIDLPKLKTDTTYYWRVDEVQADGSAVTGDVWSFNT